LSDLLWRNMGLRCALSAAAGRRSGGACFLFRWKCPLETLRQQAMELDRAGVPLELRFTALLAAFGAAAHDSRRSSNCPDHDRKLVYSLRESPAGGASMAKKRSAKKVTKKSDAHKKKAKRSNVRKRSSKNKGVAKTLPAKKRKAKAAKTGRAQALGSKHVKEEIKAEAPAPARPDRASPKRAPDTITQKVTNVITAVFDTVAEARALEKKTMDPDRTNDDEGE
jgi:hypothetical protein